jgi:hypothetical protein
MNKNKSAAVLWCTANKILVYPVLSDPKTKMYKIEAVVSGKKRLFDKEITAKELDSAIEKTYKYYYDKSK